MGSRLQCLGSRFISSGYHNIILVKESMKFKYKFKRKNYKVCFKSVKGIYSEHDGRFIHPHVHKYVFTCNYFA